MRSEGDIGRNARVKENSGEEFRRERDRDRARDGKLVNFRGRNGWVAAVGRGARARESERGCTERGLLLQIACSEGRVHSAMVATRNCRLAREAAASRAGRCQPLNNENLYAFICPFGTTLFANR